MSNHFASLVKEHHAFYEVLPYYLVLQESRGSFPPNIRRVQAGFDVDVYGVNIKGDMEFPEGVPDYVLGYTMLRRIAEEISHGASTAPALHEPGWTKFRGTTSRAILRFTLARTKSVDAGIAGGQRRRSRHSDRLHPTGEKLSRDTSN
jgi:hypothetical protein